MDTPRLMNEHPDATSPSNWVRAAGYPREVIGDAILHLQDAAARLGLKFYASHDWGAFKAHRTQADPSIKLNPRWDPAYSRLEPGFAVAIRGFDAEGRSATFGAVRVYEWHDGRNLASEARTLRLYYDRPDLDARFTEHACQLPAIAERISGRVAVTGALWVRRDLRGPRPELGQARVSQLVSALNRLTAVGGYDAGWCVATTPAEHVIDGISERYGWARVETSSFPERLAIGSPLKGVHLMDSTRGEVIAEAIRLCRDGLPTPDQPRA